MKKRILLFVASVGMFITASSQMGPVSLGLELGKPVGDFGDAYPLAFGLSAGYEHHVGDNIGITAQVGWMLLTVDDELSDFIDKASMMPIQLGLKYYFSEVGSGAYAHVQLGVHSLTATSKEFEFLGVTVESETESSSNFSFAIGGGFMATEKLDIGIRFNIITPDSDIEGAEASNYIGLRLAYSLFGGDN